MADSDIQARQGRGFADHELHGRRRGRNLGVLAVLVGFAVLLFLVTIAKLGGNAANPWG